MFSLQAWEHLARTLKLTGRELQIVRGVFDDNTDFAIAIELGISPHTVHTHFERMHRKLAVKDRGQLIVLVVMEFLKLTTSPGSTMPPICAYRGTNGCPLLPA